MCHSIEPLEELVTRTWPIEAAGLKGYARSNQPKINHFGFIPA
jgi:hypothetical protein